MRHNRDDDLRTWLDVVVEAVQHADVQGVELAVVTTQPGSRSQHNVQRAGFHLFYSRAVLTRTR